MPPSSEKPEAMSLADLGDALSGFFDADWYLSRYPDVAASGSEPMHHSCITVPPRGAIRTVSSIAPGISRIIPMWPIPDSIRCCTICRWARPNCAIRIRVSTRPIMSISIPRRRPIRCCITCCSASPRGWLTEKPIAIRDYLPSAAPSPCRPRNIVVDVDHSGVSRPGADAALHRFRAGRSGPAGRAASSWSTTARRSRSCPPGWTGWRQRDASSCCATGAICGFVASVNTASRRPARTTWCC